MNIGLIFVLIFLLILFVAFAFRFSEKSSQAPGWIVFSVIGLIIIMRINQVVLISNWWILYGLMVTVNYVFTFYLAYFRYKDPANEFNDFSLLTRKVEIGYVIPVYNEPSLVIRCVETVLQAAKQVSKIANVVITIVDDASTDDTRNALLKFVDNPQVKLMFLQKNGGKKNALTCGMYGGESWREGYKIFRNKYGRQPGGEDFDKLFECMSLAGCEINYADIYLHTDSDSIVSEKFILQQIKALLSDESLGAVSGHCDVWLPDSGKYTLMTAMQVAWYYTQFRIRKASESVYGAVFCVSGPGAGFRSMAVFHLLESWVDDFFGGKIYKGATDRMLTLLVLKAGWKIKYVESAVVATNVPDSPTLARKQWTRWKQNFWRMFVPVGRFAWRTPFVVAFLTYSRLIITSTAPFILAYHLVYLIMGNQLVSAVYLIGIVTMGSIMGLVYTLARPHGFLFGILRMFMSVLSAFWGSILTLRALFMTLGGTFVWRDGSKSQKKEIPFEIYYLATVLLVAISMYFTVLK